MSAGSAAAGRHGTKGWRETRTTGGSDPLRLVLQTQLAARRTYIFRRLRSLAVAVCILLPSLGLGILGYHFLARLPWIDALLNASMLAAWTIFHKTLTSHLLTCWKAE